METDFHVSSVPLFPRIYLMEMVFESARQALIKSGPWNRIIARQRDGNVPLNILCLTGPGRIRHNSKVLTRQSSAC